MNHAEQHDIILLTLYRKTLSDNNKYIAAKEPIEILATDYFDLVKVRKFSSQEYSMLDIIDKEIAVTLETTDQNEITIQSFLLYDKDGKDGNIFECNEEYPYLSIIQVHITPDALSRVSNNKATAAIIQSFITDIDNSIKSQNDFLAESWCFKYKIYRSVSSGDFILIICSKKTNTSFLISKMLRGIFVETKGEKILLYKTFTLLGINNMYVKGEYNSECEKNYFVIRGCFSNKYWQHITNIDSELAKFIKCNETAIKERVSYLHGRYDFSININENEFTELYKIIAEKKGCTSKIIVEEKEPICNEAESEVAAASEKNITTNRNKEIKNVKRFVVPYLRFLIENNYVSYINERYLLSSSDENNFQGKYSSEISFGKDDNKVKYLNEYNAEMVSYLEADFKDVKKRIYSINGYRKKVHYHLELLNKLIALCKTINGLSDTRIYSYILMKQLWLVLEGLNSYLDLMESTRQVSIYEDIELYLQLSITALDTYAKYIRDNNMQSIQTPNYNMESNSSMEKFLIAYGEFTDKLISWYKNEDCNKEIYTEMNSFLPVMYSDLSCNAVSIEILFPEIAEIYGHTEENKKRLMVVKCSSMRDLANVPFMLTALFHEVAHQLRYESRSERNEMILRYCCKIIFNPMIERIKNDISHNVKPFIRYDSDFDTELEKIISDVYIRMQYMYLPANKDKHVFKEDIMNMSLIALREKIKDDFENMANLHILIDSILDCVDRFIEKFKFKIDLKNNRSLPKKLLNLKKLTLFAKKYVMQYRNGGLSEKELVDKLNKMCDIAQKNVDYILDCKIPGFDKDIDIIIAYFEPFRSDNIRHKIIGAIDIEEFVSEIYDKLHKLWLNKVEQIKKLPDKKNSNLSNKEDGFLLAYRYIGRYLKIDYNIPNNKKEFSNYLKSYIFEKYNMAIEMVDYEIDQYREITSDLFMCRMLNLTPFGYLNFLAYILPINESVPEVYAKRSLYVINAIHGNILEEKKDLCICIDIMNELKMTIKTLRYKMSEITEYKDIFNDVINSSYAYKKNGSNALGVDKQYIYKEIIGIHGVCEKIKAELSVKRDLAKSDIYSEEFDHLISICKLFRVFLLEHTFYLNILEYYDMLKNDLERGSEQLKKVWEQFSKSSLWTNYCKSVSDLINRPYIRYSDDIAVINKNMISFILDMYYENKLKNGWEIRNGGAICPKYTKLQSSANTSTV